MSRPDPRALASGLAVVALGSFLVLQDLDTGVPPGLLFAGVGASAVIALALGEVGARLGAGIVAFVAAFLTGAGLLLALTSGVLEDAGGAVITGALVALAIALISAPVWWTLLRRLARERSARIRSEERAEVAAHLHDSVLQTLALIQKRAADPDAVAVLARSQERELRAWLSGSPPARPAERLADALRVAAEEVEVEHGAPVEAVVRGDTALDERFEALVAAAREALANAAKYAADGGPIRLYAEIENGSARVFVDDRGPGFDPGAVGEDRRGIRDSIVGRMRRHGGRAEIRSSPEGGTEVELEIGGGA